MSDEDPFDSVMSQFTALVSVFADQVARYRRKHSYDQCFPWANEQLRAILEDVEKEGNAFMLTDRSTALHALAWQLVLACIQAGWLDDE
jgi:hypothetical protein